MIWVHISPLTNENWKSCIEEVSGYFFNQFLINTFVGEASFKNMLPPSSDVLSNFLSKNPGVFSLFIFLSKTVHDIVGSSTYYLYTFFLTHICVMSLEHRYWCFECAWHFIFDVVSLQNILQAYGCNILEELRLSNLIWKDRLIIDKCRDKKLSILFEFTLTISSKSCPMGSKTFNPSFTLIWSKLFRSSQKEYVIISRGWRKRQNHESHIGEGEVNSSSWENLLSEILSSNHDINVIKKWG